MSGWDGANVHLTTYECHECRVCHAERTLNRSPLPPKLRVNRLLQELCVECEECALDKTANYVKYLYEADHQPALGLTLLELVPSIDCA